MINDVYNAKILGFAVILFIGWFVASLIAKGVAMLLRTVKFNDLAQRAGMTEFMKKMGVDTDASGLIANIAKWFIRLIVLVVAFDALGLPAVSDVLRQLLLWLPNLVVAMVVALRALRTRMTSVDARSTCSTYASTGGTHW